MSKIILLTGGASGLGKVILSHLVAQGHRVYYTSRKSQLEDSGGVLIQADITSDADCAAVIETIWAKEKSLDVIVNNAGVTLSGPTLNFSVSEFKNILDTNVLGSFRLLKAAFSKPQKPSLVVNITSLNGFFSFPNFGIYSASKFAAEALGLALRYELSSTTRVVNIACGALLGKSNHQKMDHRPAREKILIIKWLMPLARMDDVAQKIGKLIQANRVPSRVLIGRDAHIINCMQKLLPSWVMDKIIFFIWNKK